VVGLNGAVSILCLLPFFFDVPVDATSLPKRVVSLVPAVTEEIFLLGAQDRLVGVTTYCARPPAARAKTKVGTVIDVNVEKIRTLNPDMVLASDLTDPRQLDLLKKLGVCVEIMSQARDFDGLCAQFLQVALLVDREREALHILEVVRRDLETEVARVEGLARPKVFIQIGSDPLFTSGRGTLMDEMITLAGGHNIAHDVDGPSLYSRERVLNQNPDVILIATMDRAVQRARQSWAHYPTIAAVRHHRIHPIDPYPSCSPTPTSFTEMVGQLRGLFHGA
jgi:iron complex transport system substrate-binding protein